MRRVKQVCKDYAYGPTRGKGIIKLLELFQAQRVFVKIYDIKVDSAFGKSILPQKDKYVLLSDPSEGEAVDIAMWKIVDDGLSNMLDEVGAGDSEVEMISLYLTELPTEKLLEYERKPGKTEAASCALTIVPDESLLTVSFDPEVFDQIDWITIDETVFEIARWEPVRSWRLGCVHHKEDLMINEPDKVDYMVLDEADKSKLILAVSDHLDWQFEKEHLLLLQEKLNQYIYFILEERYKETYAEKIERFRITVFLQYQPGKKFEKLIAIFTKALAKRVPDVKIEITYQMVEDEEYAGINI